MVSKFFHDSMEAQILTFKFDMERKLDKDSDHCMRAALEAKKASDSAQDPKTELAADDLKTELAANKGLDALKQSFSLFEEARDSLSAGVTELDSKWSKTFESQLLRSLPGVYTAEDRMKIWTAAFQSADTLKIALEMEEPKKSEMFVKVTELCGRPIEVKKMQVAMGVDV